METTADVEGLAKASDYKATLKVDSGSVIDATAQSNRLTLIRAYEAQLKGDHDSWWKIFDENVEFFEAESLPYACSVKGLKAAQEGMHGMFAAWSHLDIEFENFLAAGDMVIAYLQMRATSRKTGKVYQGPVAELFRFRNGKVVEWRPIYWDTQRAREAIG